MLKLKLTVNNTLQKCRLSSCLTLVIKIFAGVCEGDGWVVKVKSLLQLKNIPEYSNKKHKLTDAL